MKHSQEKLDTLIEEPVLGYDQVETFTAKRNKIQIKHSRDCSYGNARVSSPWYSML